MYAWKSNLDAPDSDAKAWTHYGAADDKAIKEKAKRGCRTFPLNKTYMIDLNQMLQYRIDDPHRQRTISVQPVNKLAELSTEGVKTLKISSLKEALALRGLEVTGARYKLQERLVEAVKKEASGAKGAVAPGAKSADPRLAVLTAKFLSDMDFVSEVLEQADEQSWYEGAEVALEESLGKFTLIYTRALQDQDMSWEGPFKVLYRLKVPNDTRALVKYMDGTYSLTVTEELEDKERLPAGKYVAKEVKEIVDADHCICEIEVENKEVDWYSDIIQEMDEIDPFKFPRFRKLYDKIENKQVLEGVLFDDEALSKDLKSSLMKGIGKLEQREYKDFHPNSNDRVLDHVHPALYPYVKGVSYLDPSSKGDADHKGGATEQTDFFGRKYEDSVYQWLPSELKVSENGKSARFQSYINNLPRGENAPLYSGLENLFVKFIPNLELVLAYINTVRFPTEEDMNELYDLEQKLTQLDGLKIPSLKGKTVQVIPKIVDYVLKPEEHYEGVWHVEGMSHENIVATCLCILDRDVSIEGGALQFRRAFTVNEAAHIFETIPQCRAQPLEDIIVDKGLTSLGKVETKEGRLIIFPNSHVHRVMRMVNKGSKVARRRIVVFFIVNPTKRIISTADIPEQQHDDLVKVVSNALTEINGEVLELIVEYAKTGFTLKEAKDHRLKLMKERKYHKQDWNVRTIELCEH